MSENKITRAAIVTGGSQGIGKCIALQLAKDGFNVAINYYGPEGAADDVVKECESYGVKCFATPADVSKSDEMQAFIKRTMDEYGRIDCLVNNAGITRDNLLLRMTEAEFDSVIATNLKGTYNTIKHITPIMLKQRTGSIINISSVVGVTGNAGQVNYSASKAGVIGITKSTAKELASRGIRCNAIAPGYIQTDMTAVLSKEVLDGIMAQIPLKRPGQPQDIANLVSFLAGPDSDYITGQVLHVDGGMVM